jgi:hypothetical protein
MSLCPAGAGTRTNPTKPHHGATLWMLKPTEARMCDNVGDFAYLFSLLES